ncbi:MAG: hypothetical protein SPF89_08035 [Sphaerochaetaceae bacterium]|nr:hypothetical protein [Spirochaetales bacterium]MDY5500037.1 hypothetical protein [Sphaerochaetaceae bacterium]
MKKGLLGVMVSLLAASMVFAGGSAEKESSKSSGPVTIKVANYALLEKVTKTSGKESRRVLRRNIRT